MPQPLMKDVYSSHVNSIGYDAPSSELWVTWDTGKTSIYSRVPPQTADSVMKSWSVGKALTAEVKPNFPHRYAS